MYLTLKQQVKHLSKKEFRNLKYLYRWVFMKKLFLLMILLNSARTLATQG